MSRATCVSSQSFAQGGLGPAPHPQARNFSEGDAKVLRSGRETSQKSRTKLLRRRRQSSQKFEMMLGASSGAQPPNFSEPRGNVLRTPGAKF